MRLDINHSKKTRRNTKTLRLNNKLMNNPWVNKEIKRKLKNTQKPTKMDKHIQNLWDAEKSSEREFHNQTGLPQEIRKISDKKYKCTFQET